MSEHMSAHLGLLPLEERIEKMAEIDRKAAEYEQHQRDKAELARIEGRRADLERHLTERATRYLERTGSQPSADLVATWTDQYATEREHEHQAARQRRYDAAEAADPIF